MTPRSVVLSFLKPIRFKLLGGNFRVRTHPHMQVDLLPYRMENSVPLIPKIIEHNDHIEISGQNFFKLMKQSERVDVTVLLPERSVFDFDMKAGVLEVDGLFKKYSASLLAGEAVIIGNQELEQGNAKVGIGSIAFYAKQSDKIEYKKDTFLNKKFRFNETSQYDLKMRLIGGVDVRSVPPKWEKK